jgi:hypothetical protein
MEEQFPKDNNNIIELNEDVEEQNKKQNVNQTPTRHLRDIKKVNYSKFFSDDQDNSEDYEPEEKSEKIESTKKRPRPKSVSKANVGSSKKKKEEDKNQEKKMEVEEDNEDKKNKNQNGYGYIINIDETFAKYINSNIDNTTNNPNNINIPNSELILIIMEICLNGVQYGLEKDNSSRLFWEEVGKIDKLKPITSKFKTETLRKYWRTIREAKKFRKIISETRKYANELNNNNLKLLSSIKIICEYVSSHSKRKIEYYLNKHIVKPSNKSKKINVNDMSPSEQISDVINTFMTCFPKKKEKEIIDALLQTSFDIENAFLLLKDRDNLGFFAFSDKDDEIVKRNFEDKDDKNEEYIELVNIKGLEDVIRRKEFLFNVKIDRSQYNKIEEESPCGKEESYGNVEKKENNEENKDESKEKNNEEKNEKEKKGIEVKEEGKKDDKEKVKGNLNG